MKKYKLIKKIGCYTIFLASLAIFTGCAKKVDCSIEGEHVHLYVNNDKVLFKYLESEKEYVGDFYRTEEHLEMNKEFSVIIENELYLINDNLNYLTNQINNHQPYRETYKYDYIYGYYYGYGPGYNMLKGKYDYGYCYKLGWHYDYHWVNIPLDEYTNDKVRDITYQYKVYKIKKDGTISSKVFDSLDEISEEYKYFKPNDFIKKNTSSSYYLEKEKIK